MAEGDCLPASIIFFMTLSGMGVFLNFLMLLLVNNWSTQDIVELWSGEIKTEFHMEDQEAPHIFHNINCDPEFY